jgi:type II secretory pathway component PulJ
MRRRPRHSQQGLTLLLEAMLGLTLISVVLLVIFQLFPVSDRSVGLADRTTQANQLARELMEKQLEKRYDQLLPGVTTGERLIADHTQRRGQSLSTEYVWKVTVTQADPPDAELRDIEVTVSWKDGSAHSKRPSEVTLRSVRGNLW